MYVCMYISAVCVVAIKSSGHGYLRQTTQTYCTYNTDNTHYDTKLYPSMHVHYIHVYVHM